MDFVDDDGDDNEKMEIPNTGHGEAIITGNFDKNFRSRCTSDDLFSEPRSTDDDGMMNFTVGSNNEQLSITSLPRRQYTKLEVVQAYQIQNLLHSHHVFVLIGLIYTVIMIALANFKYGRIFPTQQLFNWEYDLRIFTIPNGLNWFNQLVEIPMFLYVLILSLCFTKRIFRIKVRTRTKEQIWIIFLLFSMVLYLNPFRAIVKINDVLLNPGKTWYQWQERDWCKIALKIAEALEIVGFTSSTVFHVWASIHSYRMLNTKITYMFYVPKILVLSIYVISKLVIRTSYNVVPSELFFASFIAMVSTYNTAQIWYKPGVWYASLSLVFEIILTVYIILEYRATRKVLQNADYLKYRTQQIGFRFFVYHNLTFYLVFICLYIALQTCLPNGYEVFLLRFSESRTSYFKLLDLEFGIKLMLIAYVTVEAYVNLPADASGFFGRKRRGHDANRIELEPITYRKREPPSLHGIVSDLRVNCFVMQTHVTLFNFAWLVYYWNTPKVDNFQLTQDVFKFVVADYIADEETDTHALIIDGADRIVIAFKGTTSSKNLKTDINMFYSKANQLLPTNLGDTEENIEDDKKAKENDILRTHHWRRSKIHKGFAVAYSAVASRLLIVLKRLQDERHRPVFITGHSLGGALATICSLDLYLRLNLHHKEIFVSTFGAPRVGNKNFQMIYNDCVPIHWRIVVGPDVVAKLPKMGYKHVGKKVLITVDGDLFIDPNSLELNIWSGDVASILYHRKASYLLAMRAWCERHHGDEYVPEFWPFPVSKDDTRRFQHAMVRSGYTSPARSGSTPKHDRIRELDAMVDALDTGLNNIINETIVRKWGVLAYKALNASDNDGKQLQHRSKVKISVDFAIQGDGTYIQSEEYDLIPTA